MNALDWSVLIGTLLFIAIYGSFKARGQKSLDGYFKGSRQLPWWVIGISVMATQASAITFMSTPGQAFEDGMRFIQFYFGLPLAMIIICIFFLPRFMQLQVLTAYEFLEKRFDLKTRLLAAILFLIQRGLAAGITIYAPAIILSTILGWDLTLTIIATGLFVILYTVSGGTEAVSQTQKQQMAVMMGGMFIIFLLTVSLLPDSVSLGDGLKIAGKMGKMNLVDFSFDLNDRYNIWSGLTGGMFLALAYFGTDQSQVSRYITGTSLTESRLGLIFNGLLKVPMQFFILICGVMVYVFYLFTPAPLFFNRTTYEQARNTAYQNAFSQHEASYEAQVKQKTFVMDSLVMGIQSGNEALANRSAGKMKNLEKEQEALRDEVKATIKKALPSAETRDTDYVFLRFVLDYMPHGIIGLLLAVIFCASMSSTSSEITALSSATAVDLYRRSHEVARPDTHYVKASRFFTILWGLMSIVVAIFTSLFDNLIEAVNILGSLFYGTVLGIFLVAFFQKNVKGTAVFAAAIIAEVFVLLCFFSGKLVELGSEWLPQVITGGLQTISTISFLWYNVIGCLLVMGIAGVLSLKKRNLNLE